MCNEITFEIRETIGNIKGYPTGWSKELNIVAWNGERPRFDIRDWSPDHDMMSRGITLTELEAVELYKLLKKRFEREV